MILNSKKKIALVTGGAKRIGRQICDFLILNNWQVILHYNHSEKEAKEFASSNKAVIGLEECDFTNPLELDKFAQNIFMKLFILKIASTHIIQLVFPEK